MSTVKDEVGNRYGRLVVLERGVCNQGTHATWICRCDCSKITTVRGANLRTGKTRSCSCLKNEIASKIMSATGKNSLNYKHGMTGTKVHNAYKTAKYRCNNKNNKDYYHYGGRGIKFLFKSFKEFYKELGDPPTPEHSIDRINNNGNYVAGNIQWATMKEQANNRRPKAGN